MTHPAPKNKLIEVALPLEAINKASAREVHSPRPPLHAASVVGAATPRRGACRDLRADGRRPLGPPGPLPHREGAGEGAPTPLPHHRGVRPVGEHHQRNGAASRRATKSGKAGVIPVPKTPTTRRPRSYSTATNCPPSTTPLPAAARCPWRRSAWGWRVMPATSTRWRC